MTPFLHLALILTISIFISRRVWGSERRQTGSAGSQGHFFLFSYCHDCEETEDE